MNRLWPDSSVNSKKNFVALNTNFGGMTKIAYLAWRLATTHLATSPVNRNVFCVRHKTRFVSTRYCWNSPSGLVKNKSEMPNKIRVKLNCVPCHWRQFHITSFAVQTGVLLLPVSLGLNSKPQPTSRLGGLKSTRAALPFSLFLYTWLSYVFTALTYSFCRGRTF